jgi:uncharacterized membrane protein YhiD involved in acid resistance
MRLAIPANGSGKEIAMPFNNLYAFFNKHRVAAAKESHAADLPYRIVTTCRTSEVAKLEELMRKLLSSYNVTFQGNQPAVQAHLTSITVEVMCSVRERGGLVQLVTRLAQEISVRSVRWESIPQRSARAVQAKPASRAARAATALPA